MAGFTRRRGWRIAVAVTIAVSLAVSTGAQTLDVDDNGTVDVYTDIIYIARTLLGLPPVPPSFRTANPDIDPDPTIAARVERLLPPTEPGGPTPTRTVTRTATPSATSTATFTVPPPFTPSVTRTASLTATNTGTRTETPTISPTPSRTFTERPSPATMEGTDVVKGAAEVAVQNQETFGIIDLGCAAARCGRPARRGALQFGLAPRTAMRAADGVGQASATPVTCSRGGMLIENCTGPMQTILYEACAEPASPGSVNTVTRTGTTTLLVERPDGQPTFCESGMVVDPFADTVTLTLTDYRQVERSGGDDVAELETALWVDRFVPNGRGCVPDLPGGDPSAAAANGVQTLRGALRVFCQPGAESLTCTGGGTDLTLTVLGEDALRIVRTSGGFPCEIGLQVTGEVRVDDRDRNFFGDQCRTRFSQRFANFFLFETPDASGTTAVRQEGDLSVDALGDLQFDTRLKPVPGVTPTPGANGSIEFSDDAQCPTGGDGQLRVRRPPKTVAAAGPVAAPFTRGVSEDPSGELRHTIFRAQGGQAYQVIQNIDRFANFGAESLRITTLIGSEAGGVGQCSTSAGATVPPQAVAGASPGEAFPPGLVRKVPSLIPFAGRTTFDQNVDGGRGQVCVGPDCSDDARCPAGGSCRTFTLSQGVAIEAETAQIPAARLLPIPALDNPCAGFGAGADNGNFRAYGFGPSSTVQVSQCELLNPPGAPSPRDGFSLPNGFSVIFVYETSFASLFNAAVAGFPVDENDSTSIGCPEPGDRFLHIGAADLESVEAPLIEFSVQNGNPVVTFDFLGNGEQVEPANGCVDLGSPITQCDGGTP